MSQTMGNTGITCLYQRTPPSESFRQPPPPLSGYSFPSSDLNEKQFRDAFSLTPDERLSCFTSHSLRGAQQIIWALRGRSLALISGAEGIGKTSMLLYLARQLEAAEGYRAVVVRTPLRRTIRAFTLSVSAAVVSAFGCSGVPAADAVTAATNTAASAGGTAHDDLRQITACANEIYASGKRLALLIDDADRLTKRTFGVLHSLAVSTVEHDLAIGIVLAGNPKLEQGVNQYPALRSRLGSALRLVPLTPEEMREMIEFRLRRAGLNAAPLTEAELRRMYRLTGGVPGRIVKAYLARNHET